jgi:hypothetical protein
MNMSMRFLHAFLTIAALLAAGTAAQAQSAYDYPWCAMYGGRDGPGATSCYYRTWEECMATLSGIGGSCIQSPFYGQGPRKDPPPKRKRRDY